IYRKIKPKIENLAQQVESAEHSPSNFEELGSKIASMVDSALSSQSPPDSNSNKHSQGSDQENLEDLAAAVA